jgi:ribosome-associated translation inhibitor RaiA
MRNGQQRFPIDIRTSWVDYSPALRFHASQRIGSLPAALASQIRSVVVRIWNDEPDNSTQRRCTIDVTTTHAGLISASSVGVDLFALVDNAVETIVKMLSMHTTTAVDRERRQRIA